MNAIAGWAAPCPSHIIRGRSNNIQSRRAPSKLFAATNNSPPHLSTNGRMNDRVVVEGISNYLLL